MTASDLIEELKRLADPGAVAGMARFGINPEGTLGVSVPEIRKMAGKVKKNHPVALGLWESGIHEARLLAIFTADPKQMTESELEIWVGEFDSWDVCDQACTNLFPYTPFAWKKAGEWCFREREFERRAGFALQVGLAVHLKKEPDSRYLPFFDLIAMASEDNRNFVRKAVNWSLRTLGKRSQMLFDEAVRVSSHLKQAESSTARWIGSDAWRELTGKQNQGTLPFLRKKMAKDQISSQTVKRQVQNEKSSG